MPAGRPFLELDEELIEDLASINCSMDEIATIVGCSKRTLQNNYCAVIEKGRARGNMSLKRKMFDLAIKGNATMLIWLSKIQLGYRETTRQELIQLPSGKEISKDQLDAMSVTEVIDLVKKDTEAA